MSKTLKLFFGISYLIILFTFLYFIFSFIEITRLDDFQYYKELQTDLEKITSENLYLNLFVFFSFSIIWISLLGFGSPLLIISGILFGKWLGTFVSLISISLGALFLYLIAKFFFKEIILSLLKDKFNKYLTIFRRNEFTYFLFFRLAGGLGIPFGIQNILPVLFNIKKFNYFFASFLGFAPMFFILNSIGSGLNEYIKMEENFSIINLLLKKDIYLPIIFFLIIMFISTKIKNKIFDN